MKTRTIRLAAVMAGLLLTASARAESPAEKLEKGIYNEETVGNLDEAIKIYREIVSDSKEVQALAARAQYRLARCLSKKGDEAAATGAYQALIKNFPNQKEWIAKARGQLPAGLELQKAPWKDGEHLTLTMKLAGGQTIGMVGLGVQGEKVEGVQVWNMAIRRYIMGGQNQGVSHVVVDRDTNRPLRSSWDHTLLGAFDGVYGKDTLTITTRGSDDQPKTVDLDGPAYANDQWFFAMRQLPLKVGYKATLPTRTAFSGGAQVNIGITVPKKELIETPVGKFDCFQVEMNIGQTFWIADVPEKYLVRFEAGGVNAVLSAISDGTAQRVENAALGFAVTVPGNWFTMEIPGEKPEVSTRIILVGPEMMDGTLRVMQKSELDPEDGKSARSWAESRIEKYQKFFKEVKLCPEGIADTTLAGMPAADFVADYVASKREFTVRSVAAIGQAKAVEVSVLMPRKGFAKGNKAYEEIVDSLVIE